MMFGVPLTLGIEEEYQIVNPETRELASHAYQMTTDGQALLGDQVKQEFMQSQIEVGSKVCADIHEARAEIIRLRSAIAELAKPHNRVIIAASTHPFSLWEDQDITEYSRYKDLETRMQMVSRRLLIFGMHVHVGFGTTPEALDLLIDVQNQVRYFLPHILALTTSSPFWEGMDTGLKSYRSIVFENIPRTGIPPILNAYSDYMEYIETLHQAGTVVSRDDGSPDHTQIRWDARPQRNFGTLEFRVSDICTTVDECICITALIQAICAKLVKLRHQNMSWRVYPSEFIAENKWLAVRYGIEGQLIDFGKTKSVDTKDLARELVGFVDDVLDDLGSREDVERVFDILDNGTSADRQLRVYKNATNKGASKREALNQVVDYLIEETMRGV